jgi:hypothetical protein
MVLGIQLPPRFVDVNDQLAVRDLLARLRV